MLGAVTAITLFAVTLAILLLDIGGVPPAESCPDVLKANNHYQLVVRDTNFILPGGKTFRGWSYNDTYVGPTIRAKLGEEVSIDVYNKASVGTSVHWHGMAMPGSAWSDGVEGVTQRAIKPGEMFRYKFRATPAGTYWYHSHSGMQIGDGLRGPIIVEDPSDPYKGQYDQEVVLVITDQAAESGDAMLQRLQREGMPMATMMDNNPCGMAMDMSDTPLYTMMTNGAGWVRGASGKPAGSSHVVGVQQGKRYRFRVIAATASWAFKLAIGHHTMELIAKDGSYTQRTPATGLVMTPGERVDFLLTANATGPPANHWITVTTLRGANSPAVLSYAGAPSPANDSSLGEPALEIGCQIPAPGDGVVDLKLQPLQPHPVVPKLPATASPRQLVMYFALTSNGDIGGADNTTAAAAIVDRPAAKGMNPTVKAVRVCPGGSRYCWTLNWVPFTVPAGARPLLFPGARTSLGPQTYVEKVDLGTVVDVAFINPDMMMHPMHLHGYHFWLLGTGMGSILDSRGAIDYSKLNLKDPPMRDTHAVPQASGMDEGGANGSSAGMTGGTGSSGGDGGSMAGGSGMGGGRRRHLRQADTGSGGSGMSGGSGSMMGGSGTGSGNGSISGSTGYGYSVIRFKADNPGVWVLHCHVDAHMVSGMLMAFVVRQPGLGAQPWYLPANATACGL